MLPGNKLRLIEQVYLAMVCKPTQEVLRHVCYIACTFYMNYYNNIGILGRHDSYPNSCPSIDCLPAEVMLVCPCETVFTAYALRLYLPESK